jgi:hypothetical protein
VDRVTRSTKSRIHARRQAAVGHTVKAGRSSERARRLAPGTQRRRHGRPEAARAPSIRDRRPVSGAMTIVRCGEPGDSPGKVRLHLRAEVRGRVVEDQRRRGTQQRRARARRLACPPDRSVPFQPTGVSRPPGTPATRIASPTAPSAWHNSSPVPACLVGVSRRVIASPRSVVVLVWLGGSAARLRTRNIRRRSRTTHRLRTRWPAMA